MSTELLKLAIAYPELMRKKIACGYKKRAAMEKPTSREYPLTSKLKVR